MSRQFRGAPSELLTCLNLFNILYHHKFHSYFITTSNSMDSNVRTVRTFKKLKPITKIPETPHPSCHLHEDIHTAAHSPKGDESHPQHSVAVERMCNTVWTHPNWRIYVQRHTPQKGMSLILDTVSQLRGRATQFGHIPIG